MKTYQQVLDEMGKSERHELESRLAGIIEHTLKVKYVKGRVGAENLRGWNRSIRDQITELTDLVNDNPGLKPSISADLLNRVYRSVLADLTKAYPGFTFPDTRELSLKEIVGDDLFARLEKR